MTDMQKRCLALFYCQQVPGSSDKERLAIEKQYGKTHTAFSDSMQWKIGAYSSAESIGGVRRYGLCDDMP